MDNLKSDKLSTRSFRVPALGRSATKPKGATTRDNVITALTMGKQGERRPLSPVGQAPDRASEFWQLSAVSSGTSACKGVDRVDLRLPRQEILPAAAAAAAAAAGRSQPMVTATGNGQDGSRQGKKAGRVGGRQAGRQEGRQAG